MMLRLVLICACYTALLVCSLGSRNGGWVLYRGGGWSTENMAISFRTKHSAGEAWRHLVENEEEYDPKMSKADGLRLRRRLDEESKLSEAKPELPSDQQQQPDHCLVTPEVLDCEKRTIGNTIDSQVWNELEGKEDDLALYRSIKDVVKRIGVTSLGIGISIIAIRAVRAIVQLGRRYFVPSRDVNDEKEECDHKTTTAKQKKVGESVEEVEEEVIFTSTLGMDGSDEGNEAEVEGLGKNSC